MRSHKLGLVKSITALLICCASFFACGNEEGDEKSLVGLWKFEFKAGEGNICTDCTRECSNVSTVELSCFWADGQCAGTNTAGSSASLQTAFGSELISGTVQFGINDCTATADMAVSFEASRINDTQYVGTWNAPLPTIRTTQNPNGYKGTLTVRQ
jgi:hypothetical protein